MKFIETKIKDSYIVYLEKFNDKRGFFASSWNSREFKKHGLNYGLVECNISFNKTAGTIRGLHYQLKPYAQTKLVRCTRGKIFDVILDLRPKSKSYLHWSAVELSAKNYKLNYIPEGCAHGFQTLEDDTEVFYQMSQFYSPKFTKGIRWDDTAFKIKWPMKPTEISDKDLSWKLFHNKNILIN